MKESKQKGRFAQLKAEKTEHEFKVGEDKFEFDVLDHNKDERDQYSPYKIAWFPEKLQSLAEHKVTPPISSLINPTNRCNHDCFFCVYAVNYSGMHDNMILKDELTIEKLYEILDDFKDMGVKAVTFSGGGEPLLHRNAVDYLQRAVDNGLEISIITNAQLLNGKKAELLSGAKWVRASLDYYTAEGFVSSQRGKAKMFIDVVLNCKEFSKIKNKDCDFGCNWVITKENHKDIYEGAKFMKEELGMDNIKFSAVWVKDFEEYHKSMEKGVLKDLRRIREEIADKNFRVYDNYKITISENSLVRPYHKCLFMQVTTNIGADGIVYNCHNKGYDKSGMVGDINNQSFKKMWMSEETAKYFEEFDSQLSCRHQCAPDLKNIHMHKLLSLEGDNFV